MLINHIEIHTFATLNNKILMRHPGNLCCQELKYTEEDMSRLRQEMQLALQGELIAKDREWCAREQAWHREKEELVKKWDDDKAEYKNLVYVLGKK